MIASVVRAIRCVARISAVLLTVVLVVAAVGPRVTSFQVLFVRSGSMMPGMPVGSLALVTRAPASDMGRGDVIAFEHPGGTGDLVMHRIVDIERPPSGPQFVTKGDANRRIDPWRVPATGSGWRRVADVPWVGYVLGYAQAALATPGLLLVITWGGVVAVVVQLWRRPRQPQPVTS